MEAAFTNWFLDLTFKLLFVERGQVARVQENLIEIKVLIHGLDYKRKCFCNISATTTPTKVKVVRGRAKCHHGAAAETLVRSKINAGKSAG
jgi:hypothetical protein